MWYNGAMKYLPCLVAVVALSCCSRQVADVDPLYRSEIEAWRTARLERLTTDDGWLTVVGLDWLRVGDNRFGSAPRNEVRLDAPGVPPVAGTLAVADDGTVTARAPASVGVTVNGEPFTETVLATDAAGDPDILGLGRLRFYVIRRGERLAVRVKDPESANRTGFAGLEYYPIDPSWRVTATLEPYDAPREVSIPTVTGDSLTMLAPGVLHFSLAGTELTLEPYVSSPDDDEYFFVVRDRTSGDTTYGGGRFLTAPVVGDDGRTTIDFNYAYSPPCAFTAFATCPLPTPRNTLAVAIEAGEKFRGSPH